MTTNFTPHPDCPDWRPLAEHEDEAVIRLMGDAVQADDEARPEAWRTGFTRRQVLAGGLGVGVAALGSQLVVVFLRGGMDGLSALVPADNPQLLTWRPDIAVRAGNLMRVDERFDLHPALGALQPMLAKGRIAAVPDISTNHLSRSHFQAQDCLERGGSDTSSSRGWLDRVLELSGEGTTFRSMSVTSNLTCSLAGVTSSLVARSPQDLTFRSPQEWNENTRTALGKLYAGLEHPLAAHARIALDVDAEAAMIGAAQDARADIYPEGGFGDQLRTVSTLIQQDRGLRVATLDLGGWDMHTAVDNVDGGDMKNMLTALGDGLAAFFTDLGEKADSTTVILMSEFGRRVDQNASGGVDHGHGGLAIAIAIAIAIGTGVRGGVYGTWPGLAQAALPSNDLPGTNDFRDFLSEIVLGTVGLSEARASQAFDGWKRTPLGFMTPVAA